MEILGTLDESIVSISPSSLNSNIFVSLSQSGSLALWDTRQSTKYHLMNSGGCNNDYSEVLCIYERSEVLSVCEDTIELYDIRKVGGCVKKYTHDVEVVQFLSGIHKKDATTTLFVDENGAVVPFDILSVSPSPIIPAYVFGSDVVIAAGNDRFGTLPNYCCGFEQFVIDDNHFLLTLGMDGEGKLFSSADDMMPFLFSQDMEATGQIVNPPLPTCSRVFHNLIAVGRADGTYTIATINPNSDTCITEELSAPGHECSGLCAVEWVGAIGNHRLLTVSLSGDITAWNVLELLNVPEEELEENNDDLPPVSSAYTTREITKSKNSIINCVCKQSEELVVLGDTLGNVISCKMELQ